MTMYTYNTHQEFADYIKDHIKRIRRRAGESRVLSLDDKLSTRARNTAKHASERLEAQAYGMEYVLEVAAITWTGPDRAHMVRLLDI
jgi:hypothetical protein